MREQLRKPIPSPVVLGEATERFREAVKEMAERERIPIHPHRPAQPPSPSTDARASSTRPSQGLVMNERIMPYVRSRGCC
jgi:hypothetical protein